MGHWSRTLEFSKYEDEPYVLYIAIGSLDNVDRDSYRARIRRFDLNKRFNPNKSKDKVNNDNDDIKQPLPFDFKDGVVIADGLRNSVGMAWDKHSRLWSVENSMDNLMDRDLGGDIHNDNPGEELHRHSLERFKKRNNDDESIDDNDDDDNNHGNRVIPEYFGYPYCYTSFHLPHINMKSDQRSVKSAPENKHSAKGVLYATPGFRGTKVKMLQNVNDLDQSVCIYVYIYICIRMQHSHKAV